MSSSDIIINSANYAMTQNRQRDFKHFVVDLEEPSDIVSNSTLDVPMNDPKQETTPLENSFSSEEDFDDEYFEDEKFRKPKGKKIKKMKDTYDR